MLKRLNPEIAIGFLVASIFWIGVLGWQSSYSPGEIDKRQCEESARKSGHNSEECKTIWEKTTTDPVAFFTFWLVISTVGLWAATGVGILIQTKDTRILQRAHITVKPLGFAPFVTGDFISCDVSFENVGHLPARNVRWFIDRQFSDARFLKDFEIKEDRFEGKNVIPPGTAMRKGGHGIERATIDAAEGRIANLGKTAQQWIYVWGEVRYDDGFGVERFTKFCHRYNFAAIRYVSESFKIPKKYARYHVYGNDAD